MRGNYDFYRPNPNEHTQTTWVGKRVAFNGSDRTAEVVRAYWQGPGKAVELIVSENGATPFFTDSEHVTLVKEA